MQVTMIGLGKLGLPVAEVMAKHHSVKGFDTNPNISSQCIDIKPTLYEAVDQSQIIFIAVPTPHDPEYGGESPTSHLPVRDFDYTHLIQTLNNLSVIISMLETKPLIVNISTVLPGTLRPIIHQLSLQNYFCYNPYLIAMGTVAHDFIHPDIMMLGFDRWPDPKHQTQADVLIQFYQSIQTNTPHTTCGTWEEAECIKIFHNTYISAKVGIANMIQDVTRKIGHANPSTIAESLRHADRIVSGQYMEPGMGDGGPCHPRDNIALSWLAHRLNLGYDLFHDIMRAREQQARAVAHELCRHPHDITIMGRAFKPGTDLRDGSTAELVAHYCFTDFMRECDYDHVSEHARTYLLAHRTDWSHFRPAPGSVVIDMYRQYPRDAQDCEVIWYGCA